MSDIREQLSGMWIEIQETLKLNIDYARLTATEKLTILLSMVGLVMICFAIVSMVIFLLSLGLMLLLAKSTGLFLACMIVAGIYAVIMAVVIVLRKQLIIDPITRFLSKLFLK